MKKNIFGFGSLVIAFAILLLFLTSQQAKAYSVSVNKTSLIQGECLTLSWSGFGDTCNIIVYKGTTQWTYASTQAPYQGTQQICTSGWEIRNDYKIRVELKSSSSIYLYSQNFAVQEPKPYLLDFLINGGATSTTSSNLTLQFSFTTGSPTQYIISEYSNFSGASWKQYTGNNVLNYQLIDLTAGTKFVFFKLRNDTGESNYRMANVSFQPILYYGVSGFVRDANNQPTDSVAINGFPVGGISTNVNGYYSVGQIISTWSGTITPSKSGYTFSPASRYYSGLTGNMTNQNFTAIPNASYSWQTGIWGECNDTCGGGKKKRVVLCVNSANSQTVSDNYCTSTKPAVESTDCPTLGPAELCNGMGGEQYTNP